jgi:hypothetical protein
MLTIKKLEKFVRERNRSGHNSNFQFQIDAEGCGFKVGDLGKVRKFRLDNGNRFTGYEWTPTVAVISQRCHQNLTTVRLIEFGASIYLSTNTDHDTASLLDLMKRATYLDDQNTRAERATK